jgi:hypothetical protein
MLSCYVTNRTLCYINSASNHSPCGAGMWPSDVLGHVVVERRLRDLERLDERLRDNVCAGRACVRVVVRVV